MAEGRWRAALAAALGAVFLMAQAPAQQPQDLVRALYSEAALTFDAMRSASYFSRDLDAALEADGSTPGDVGAVDFDYRYGAQDAEVTGLQLLQEADRTTAKVVAVFKNHGRPELVDWNLCRRTNGEWRIYNASSNTGPEDWDLRQMLKLPAERVRC